MGMRWFNPQGYLNFRERLTGDREELLEVNCRRERRRRHRGEEIGATLRRNPFAHFRRAHSMELTPEPGSGW
jgi:hypothetical protein